MTLQKQLDQVIHWDRIFVEKKLSKAEDLPDYVTCSWCHYRYTHGWPTLPIQEWLVSYHLYSQEISLSLSINSVPSSYPATLIDHVEALQRLKHIFLRPVEDFLFKRYMHQFPASQPMRQYFERQEDPQKRQARFIKLP
jgi:hypothetical protein